MSEKKMNTLFRPGKWLAKIEFINRLLIVNNVLMAVFADRQGGKTSFLPILQQGLDCSISSQVIKVSESFDEQTFLAELGSLFECQPDELCHLVQHINDQQASVLLIIDDAQYLPFPFLEKLLTEIKKQGDNNYFHICLLSDYTLAEPLNVLNKSYKNLIHSFELGSLSEQEIKTWLMEKLPPSPALKAEKIAEFYQLTGGNISKINALMSDFFSENKKNSVSKSKSRRIHYAGFGAALALAAFSCGYLQWAAIPAPGAKTAALKQQPKGVPESQVPHLTLGAVVEHASRSPFTRIVDYEGKEGEMEVLAVIDKVVIAPKSMYRHRTIPAEYFISSLAPVPEFLVAGTKPVLPAVHAAAKAAVKSGYTIQLLASVNKKTLQSSHVAHSVKGQVKILKSHKNGTDWYVLTLGQFKDRKSAEKALQNIPQSVARLHPWIRPVNQLREIS